MPGIDGLRAIAVAAVFLYHAGISWMPGGFFGVDVFFVISGYLITSLLIAELDGTGTVRLRRFWAGRARRLLPALFLLLAVCLVIGATVERGKLVDLHGDALASIFYVANWRFIFEHESYFAQFGRPPLLRHLWSLAVEEQFYIIWPPLFLLAMRLRRRAIVPVLVGLAALGSTALMWALYTPGADTSRVFYGTDTRAAPLLVGVLLAFLWKPSAMPTLRAPARNALNALSFAALAGVIYAFAEVHDYDELTYRGGFLILALCTAVLLATIAHPQSVLGRTLARRIPRWLGERSYGIYLWHGPVLVMSRPGIDVHLARGILIPLQALVTVVIAAVSYRFVEQPIRTGSLRRIRLRAPPLLAQPRTPFAFASGGAAVLLALVALTPQGHAALPPGIDPATLASSAAAAAGPVLPPHHKPTTSRSSTSTTTRTSTSTTTGSRTPTSTQTTRTTTHSSTASRHLRRHRLTTATIPPSGPILAVGDSVMLGASTELEAALGPELHIDAVVSRQPEETIARLLTYRAEGSLPQRVIVHIGDNGPVYWADIERLRAALSGVPLVVIVSVRVDTSWQNEVNTELLAAVKSWPQATMANWNAVSGGTGLLADGTHTTPRGARLFASVIAAAIHHPHFRGIAPR
jgi:peptidoglycan/LPS O-acetylase OafA/YrhL